MGSHSERKFAIDNNFGFIWSFPVTSSIEIMITKGWGFFLRNQIKRWILKLNNFKNIKFILYEDTQPLGVYLNKISTILGSNAKCICIQHGFFPENLGIRYDGSMTKYNFVWDHTQINLIGKSSENTYVIGLPYHAVAKKSNHISVVLVGLGTAGDGNESYEKSLKIYKQIKESLNKLNILDIIYRPHPNEWGDKILIARLESIFGDLDRMSKIERLNCSRSIFIGTISSLLYEAGIAGHIVASLRIHCDLKTLFKTHFNFAELEVNNFISWVQSNKDFLLLMDDPKEVGFTTPEDKFLKLINNLS